MDYLSFDSSHLLSGEEFFGFGWYDTSSYQIDGGTTISTSGMKSSMQSRENIRTSSPGGYYGSDRHIAKLATPLDPLLKYLKKTYAGSAGPRDVFGCAVPKEDLDRWLNDSKNDMPIRNDTVDDGGRRRSLGGLSVHEDPLCESSSRELRHPLTGRQTADASLPFFPSQTDSVLATAENPIPQQGTSSSFLLLSTQDHCGILGEALVNPATANRKERRRMPEFCYPPTTHVESLLRTTPHLRHLTTGPTDMSGLGTYGEPKNFLHKLLKGKGSTQSNSSSLPDVRTVDYGSSILRQRANRRASLELASFLRTLSNEMPHDKFVAVESEVYSKVFSLVHSKTVGADERLAGVAALDALLSVPSFDQDKKAIRFGNNLSNGLKSAVPADYEFLHAVARALGKMASSTSNVDRVEFEIGRSLEWLRSDRSDRRLAAVLVLGELAREAPTAFYGKTENIGGGGVGAVKDGLLTGLGDLGLGRTNEFLDNIFPVLRDDQLIVRVCAADALSECIKILMERQPRSMTAPLCTLYSSMMAGLSLDASDKTVNDEKAFTIPNRDTTGPDVAIAANVHGSLLVVSTFLGHAQNFMMPRFDEVSAAVLAFIAHPFALLKLEVARLIPKLAQLCPGVYGMRYLERSLDFLVSIARTTPPPKGVDMRPTAFASIGLLAMAMRDEEMPQVTIMSTNPSLDSDVMDGDAVYHLVELKDESDFHARMDDIFLLISENLRRRNVPNAAKVDIPSSSRCEVLGCLANMVEALGELSSPYIPELIEDLFESGLSENLIKCLQSIAASLPSEQTGIERRLLNEISFCLTGKKTLDIISNLFSELGSINLRPSLSFFKESSLAVGLTLSPGTPQSIDKDFMSSMSLSSMNPILRPKKIPKPDFSRPETEPQQGKPGTCENGCENNIIAINSSQQPDIVYKLVLSLRTLRTIGTSYLRTNVSDGNNNMLLPFLEKVISEYLTHSSSDVRQEAAITCCMLLLPFKQLRSMERLDYSLLRFDLSWVSASIMEEVLQKLLRMAASDSSPTVRLCVIRGLDNRYDAYLCQLNLLSPLFLMLEDEALAVRACTLQLLGRLARLNPASILPLLRKVLIDLIIELSCGAGNSGGREAAMRLIVVFLREEALQRLILGPVVSSIIESLPLSNVAPRLVSISLEALGELAIVAHSSINPWMQELIPQILNNMQDQNSSKQRISLSTLGKIAFGTGYVITPYVEYPQLLSQASDILPTTKRAPWELRREVFRLFGILGALDPDRLGSSSHKARGGGVGGPGYFVEFDEDDETLLSKQPLSAVPSSPKRGAYRNQGDLQPTLSPAGFGCRNVSSSVPEFRASNSDGKGLQVQADGMCHRSMHKSSDNDEPAHLYMYEQYAMTSQPLSVITSQKRLVPSDDDFYPTVAIAALMKILKNQSLSNLHGMVMKAVMFIFNALGIQSVPFLKQIVPHIISTIKSSDQPGIREALLQQLTSLSSIVREHLRPYLTSIFEVVEEFWFSRHLNSLCTLVERVATAVPDDVRDYTPLLVRLILSSIEDVDTSEWSNSTSSSSEMERLVLILKFTRQCTRHEFFHLLIPALVRLTDLLINPDPDGRERNIRTAPPNNSSRSNIAVETVVTISLLLQSLEVNTPSYFETSIKSNSSLPARVVQPFLRMLDGEVLPNKAVGTVMIDSILICARQLGAGRWLSFYHSIARDTIESWQINVGIDRTGPTGECGEPTGETSRSQVSSPTEIYDEVVAEMTSNSSARSGLWMANEDDGSRSEFSLERSRVSEVSLAGMVERLRSKDTPNPPFIQSITNATTQRSINIEKLQKSWDVSQRTSREDYDEWLRRFSIQLLQEAPSAALRACAELAASYPPLARELFSSAFVCCWTELSSTARSNLVYSLQRVFASEASLEILQLLLNLAEFMEHDVDNKGASGGLPIKISVLAELAIKCRAYSKALHYKELEYIQERSGSCVEYLIDINKKLDLPEAALGVLKAARIELERRGAQSLVFSHHRTNSRDTKNLAYSVVANCDSSAIELSSWAGNVMYESWLTKLGSWAEALSIYEQKLVENPFDVNSILGCMHCYDARGEWQQALNLAEMSWAAISELHSAASHQLTEYSTKGRRRALQNRRRALKLCAQASWRLGNWDLLETYTSQLVDEEGQRSIDVSMSRGNKSNDLELDFDSFFYRSVLHVHRGEWEQAAKSIDSARRAMDSRFTALLSESYKRAYPSMVAAQTLSELEEIINFRQFEMRTSQRAHLHAANRPSEKEARDHLLEVWRRRLDGCRVDAEMHSSILAVRSLILGPTDEVDATITLAALSRQAEAFRLAERTLLDPLEKMGCNLINGKIFGFDVPPSLVSTPNFGLDRVVNGEITVRQPYGKMHEVYYNQLLDQAGGSDRLFVQHKLYFAYIKHLWATDRRDESITRLGLLCNVVDLVAHCGPPEAQIDVLRVRCWLKYGDFKLALNPPGEPLSDVLATDVILSYKRATDALTDDYRAWHSWALINFRLAEQIHGSDKDQSLKPNAEFMMLRSHVLAAVKAFVLAISIGTKRWSASVQQDMLNLLTCLFKYGELHDVSKTINDGLVSIKIEAWLGVLPQLLARIHIKSKSIRSVLHPLLVRLGAKHPQALMYPLSVLLKSPVNERRVAAESLMNSLKSHSNALVEEARMVSSELIRVAILWLELWHEGLEDASRLYYGEGNVSGMLDVLLPLHQQLEKGASTRRENEFLKSFGRDLSDAHNHIKEYVRLITSSGQAIPIRGGFMSDSSHLGRSTSPANVEAEAALNQAWDLYYTVFRRINKQLPGMTTLELDQCSPALFKAKNLELSVPGTYSVDGSYVKIERFVSSVQVITSKQRPRKIIIRGNNGKDYVFLLKGHEDLRQDERVMQLFGLVNALLARDRRTNKHDLNIQRYAIAPLSHNAGVVGWVPHCDTLHCLIRDYREGNKIPLNAENREMMALAPNYDSLTVMQKVEIFTEALARTTGKGNDLYEVLWMKSTNSEEWLERRTNFTRSLAVMSMVGYILGLGDRHPSNLMLDQVSGRVLHIDFGDCFEVAMHREKFPEKVPFRLTRMLTRAMEVSGIEGSYRSTCEKTMSVLRDNKDSLVAMLEAFVYDPLISWRLLDQPSGEMMEDVEAVSSAVGELKPRKKDIQNASVHSASISAVHTTLPEPIHEGKEEDEDEDEGDNKNDASEYDSDYSQTEESAIDTVPFSVLPSESAQHAKSLQMYSEMKALAANLSTSSRIQSLTGSAVDPMIETTRSRADKSVRQRELLSFIDRDDGDTNNEEALNEKALKVIRRVQDKLTGTDFHSSDEVADPLDVQEQVQRLIVQATSSENLCQLFIGWCAFW